MSNISGVHHITSIASDAERALNFYVGGLGLTPLRKTVNFDEHSVLQFYCGDANGSPGTIISFFLQEKSARGKGGTGQVSNIVFSIPAGSYDYWQGRLTDHGIDIEGNAFAFGERYLLFRDPDGLPLSLVESSNRIQSVKRSGDTLAVGRIRSIELQLNGFEHTASFLTGVLGFERGPQEGAVSRFRMGSASDATMVDLISAPNLSEGVSGPGVAHHVAWRVADDATLLAMRNRLAADGLDITPPLDREYFQAAYFVAPGGVRFALATDGPGFPELEIVSGSEMPLSLPRWLEQKRKRIEKRLS